MIEYIKTLFRKINNGNDTGDTDNTDNTDEVTAYANVKILSIKIKRDTRPIFPDSYLSVRYSAKVYISGEAINFTSVFHIFPNKEYESVKEIHRNLLELLDELSKGEVYVMEDLKTSLRNGTKLKLKSMPMDNIENEIDKRIENINKAIEKVTFKIKK